jgi:hypothetical protein
VDHKRSVWTINGPCGPYTGPCGPYTVRVDHKRSVWTIHGSVWTINGPCGPYTGPCGPYTVRVDHKRSCGPYTVRVDHTRSVWIIAGPSRFRKARASPEGTRLHESVSCTARPRHVEGVCGGDGAVSSALKTAVAPQLCDQASELHVVSTSSVTHVLGSNAYLRRARVASHTNCLGFVNAFTSRKKNVSVSAFHL